MIAVFRIVWLATTAAALALVAWRIRRLIHGPRPARGRWLNEWAWTLLPLLVLGALGWQAMGIK